MIFNPIVVGGGAKIYTITDTIGSGAPTSAKAGEIVSWSRGMKDVWSITADDLSVPSSYGVPFQNYGTFQIYFVMPASNVTIS